MTAHAAVPAVSGGDAPSTVSRGVVSTLLREEVGFEGVAISDALNMRALAQDEAGRAIEAIAALQAGQDLLLLTAGDAERTSLEQALLLAVRRGLVDPGRTAASLERVARLRRRLAAPPADGEPGLDVVGCAAHRAIADELAQRALTLVRDDAGLLPLRLDPGDELLAVMPRPVDLTPADTSSFVPAGLAAALGRHHPRVREVLVSQEPTAAEVAGAVAAAQTAATVVVGTISASLQPGQASLVEAILDAGTPTVTVALRTPWDGEAYPRARTHLCTYSVLEPSLIALADGLFGAAPFQGRMPVRAVAAWA
jgi:beta-N-acetylhexosaminidase